MALDIRGIHFEVQPPALYPPDVLSEARELDMAALANALPDRSELEIGHAVGRNENEYRHGRLFPNGLTGTRLRPNNLYADPLQVMAFNEAGRVIGEAYGANNTSGATSEARQRKMDAPVPAHKWDARRMIAVNPNYQGRGIAVGMSILLTHRRALPQPISAYAWNVPRIGAVLEAGGMRPLGEPEKDDTFGPDAPAIDRQRYVGRVITARAHILMSTELRSFARQVLRSTTVDL